VTLGSGELQAQVSLVQPTGAEQVIELVFGEQRLKAVAARHRRFAPGQSVRLDFPTRDLYLFDARSGETLYG
ncbi:MAG: TOBE domain-containing protein, partial [Gemmatimonadales bacterium]